ncbi:MAG: hypothetical protein WDZ90_02605 [Candidatus Paceibacterota bacterium]
MSFLKDKREYLIAFAFALFFISLGLTLPDTVHAQTGEDSCFGGTWLWDGVCLADITTALANILLSITGFFLGIAGALLDFAVFETVIKMGDNIKNMTAISTSWGILRDVANVTFIFILLFIGIATILRISTYGYKSLLVRLILAALLINFSLFFTQIVIDTSNLLSAEIVNLMRTEEGNTLFPDETFGDGDDTGIAAVFMNELDLQTIWDNREPPSGGNSPVVASLDGYQLLYIGLLGSALFLVAAFVFVAAAVLLMIRFVVLIFLMILSPLIFAAMVLPQTRKYWSKWWGTLFSQAFFAPAYFLLIFISLKILQGFNLSGDAPSLSQDNGGGLSAIALNPEFHDTDILLGFIIMIMFMIGSLIIAKQMGAYGASGAMNVGKSIRKNVQGVVGRNTIGRAASGTLTGYNAVQERIQNAGKGEDAGLLARGLGKAARMGRGALTVGSLGTLGDRTVTDTLKAGKKEKFGSEYSLETARKADKERGADLRVRGIKRKMDSGAQVTDEERALVRQMPAKQLVEQFGAKTLQNPKFAGEIAKAKQIDKLMDLDPEVLGAQDKEAIRVARKKFFADLEDSVAQGIVEGEKNASDVADLDRGVFFKKDGEGNDVVRQEVVVGFDPSVLDQIQRKGKLSREDKQKWYNADPSNPYFGTEVARNFWKPPVEGEGPREGGQQTRGGQRQNEAGGPRPGSAGLAP